MWWRRAACAIACATTYAEEGRNDRLIIEVPKGAYAAVFSRNAGTAAARIAAAGADSDIHANGAAAEKRQSWPAWAAGCLLAVLVGAVAVWTAQHRARVQPVPSGPVSLAILPFSNKTGDASLDYLSEGLTDSLIRQLSNVRALKLVAHDSVFRFRNETQDARGLGRKLGVANVMTGELRRAGHHLVLDAELSSVQDGSVLSSREYPAEGDDLRAAQGNVQTEVLSKLRVEDAARDPGRLGSLTTSAEAYREFLEGDFDARGGSPAELHTAIDHFEKAVKLDPKFDLA
jgi:TolB-like protein